MHIPLARKHAAANRLIDFLIRKRFGVTCHEQVAKPIWKKIFSFDSF